MSNLSPEATVLINKYTPGEIAEQVVEWNDEFNKLVWYVRLTDFIVDGHSFDEQEEADEVRKAYAALSKETRKAIEEK